MDVGDLSPGTFTGLVGATFTVGDGGDGAWDPLTLEDVVEHDPSPGQPRPDPFTLTFVGGTGPHLDQAVHTLHHPELGATEIFLVPRGPGADGRHRYDAVFN